MADGEKNLEELFYFAQSLLKEVETKKKEISNQESERGQSLLGLSSFRDRRDKALRYREWKQKFCNLTNRSNLAKSVDKVKDLEVKWSEQKRSQLLDTHQSMSGYQRCFLSTNDGDRNSHWDNTQQSITQDSYPNLMRKGIGRTKSQGPTQNKVPSEEKFYFLFGERETPQQEIASPLPIKIFRSIKKESGNESDNSIGDESHNYRSTNPSPKVTVFPKDIPINKSPFAKKRPVSTKEISTQEHNKSINRDDQNASPQRTNSKKRITEISPHRREFLKRSFPETPTPKKVTTVNEILKSKTVHIPSPSMTSWNTPKKSEVPASFRSSITSARRGEQSPATSSRIESRARSGSMKEQASSSSSISSRIKTPTVIALNTSKEKSPVGKDNLFSTSTPLGTIMEKRKLVESLKEKVKKKGIVDQQQAQAQPSSRVPLQSSRNSIRLPNNGGDMSPSKALRTTTSIKLLPNENKTRENTLNDDSPTSTASPNTGQIENNLRDRRNLRSNSCQASKDLGARNNSNSPELPRNKKMGQNIYSSRNHLKKGNSFRETSTSSKKNLMVDRNTSEPVSVKKIKEPMTPNKFSKGKESKSNILKFEKEKLIQDMLSKLNNEKHKKGSKVK